MKRRFLLLGIIPASVLAACANTADNQAKLRNIQMYVDDAVDAIRAGVAAYLASPNASGVTAINGFLTQLQSARLQFDQVTLADANARSIAGEVITFMQQLLAFPPITVALGPIAVEVSLALAVIRAFVNALPPPPDAPETPPPQLRRAAARYRLKG